jgi:hypothetical protein
VLEWDPRRAFRMEHTIADVENMARGE